MSITIKRGGDVLPNLQKQLDGLQLEPNMRRTGAPTVFELRLQLPADPAARELVEKSVVQALELATALGGSTGNNSGFVAGALDQIFGQIPKSGSAFDLMLQVASVPIHVDYGGGSHGTGAALRASFEAFGAEPGKP